MFVLRAVFWLTIIAFILPVAAGGRSDAPILVHDIGYGDESPRALAQARAEALAEEPEVSAKDLLLIAAQSANDLLGFCDRNPDICAKSRLVAHYVGRQTLHYGGQAVTWLAAQINGSRTDETQNAPATARDAAPRTPRPRERLAGA